MTTATQIQSQFYAAGISAPTRIIWSFQGQGSFKVIMNILVNWFVQDLQVIVISTYIFTVESAAYFFIII